MRSRRRGGRGGGVGGGGGGCGCGGVGDSILFSNKRRAGVLLRLLRVEGTNDLHGTKFEFAIQKLSNLLSSAL